MRIRAFVVLALLALAACGRDEELLRQREDALKANLAGIRQAIASYHKDRGQYPASLNDLVPNYLRKIPADPITQTADWRVTTEETVQPNSDFQTATTTAAAEAARPVVIDVHSNAQGTDSHGVPYANY